MLAGTSRILLFYARPDSERCKGGSLWLGIGSARSWSSERTTDVFAVPLETWLAMTYVLLSFRLSSSDLFAEVRFGDESGEINWGECGVEVEVLLVGERENWVDCERELEACEVCMFERRELGVVVAVMGSISLKAIGIASVAENDAEAAKLVDNDRIDSSDSGSGEVVREFTCRVSACKSCKSSVNAGAFLH